MTVSAATRYEVLLFDEGTEEWVLDPRLRLETIVRPVWPQIPRAEFSLVLADVGEEESLRMEDALDRAAYGQKVLVKEADEEPGDGKCLFVGRVTGKILAWNGENEEAHYCAKHLGMALQERFVVGAHGRAYGDFTNGEPDETKQTWFPGWSSIVNPGGRGNMSLTPYKEGGEEKCRLFSPPGSTLSTYGTTKRVLAYLFFWAQAEGEVEGITFPDLSGLGEGVLEDQPKDFDLEGKSWWENIGLALECVGWRCRQDTGGTGTNPTAFVAMWKIGSGTHRTLHLGAAGGAVTSADNAQQGMLNFDVSGMVTVPRIWGGPLLVEGGWPLVPGWKTVDFDSGARPAEGDDPDEDPDLWQETYYKRYIAGDTRATQFPTYQDVGRKWVANEAGDYGAAYGSPGELNFSAAYADGLWAKKRRQFLRCLSWHDLKNYAPIRVQITFDSGAHWHDLDQAEILADECGVRITVKDLSSIKVPEDSGAEWFDYWESLCEDLSSVRVRVTACVADDSAVLPDPPLVVPAWSPWDSRVELPYDRRAEYGRRVRITDVESDYDSQWVSDYPQADTTDDTAALTAEALAIQAATATAAIRGPVVLPNTTYAFDPGDVVTEISGRGISLKQDGEGGAEIYAEVIQVSIVVGEGIYATQVLLEDARLALVR